MTSARTRATGVLLAAVLLTAGCGHRHGGRPATVAPPVRPSPTALPVVAHLGDVIGASPAFGVATVDHTTAGIDRITRTADCRPQWNELFVSVYDGVNLATLQSVAGTPIVSLEPWRPGAGVHQPDFTLQATIDGRWDARYLAVAHTVVAYHRVVMLRFAHEMNGSWYPWGPTMGNTEAQYVQAWRHVVTLFRRAGAVNVLWVWSPNIIRGASSRGVARYWPGSAWVDLVGVTGYGVHETSPQETYGPTLTLLDRLTAKPIVLTETGAQADNSKQAWITAFGPWLHRHPRIAGFVWTQKPRGQLATGDWRFDDTPGHLAAFKTTLAAAGVAC